MLMRYEVKMLGVRVSIGLLPLVFIISVKWNPVMKVWKKSGVDVDWNMKWKY